MGSLGTASGMLISGRKISKTWGGSKYHQLILEAECLVMEGMVGSRSLSPWPLGRNKGDSRPIWWRWGDRLSPERLTSLLSPQGPRRNLSQAGDSGDCACRYLHAQGPFNCVHRGLRLRGPSWAQYQLLFLPCHRISRASRPRGAPNPVTNPTQCSSGLSCTPVMMGSHHDLWWPF